MQKTGNLIPLFYTRGLNPPYTEGHIQVVRMITKSLLLYGIKSLVFNFKYRLSEPQNEDDFISKFRVEQRIPIFNREDVISSRSRSILAYSCLMETLKIPKFFLFENALKHKNYVVNITNCFRYPRILVKKMLKAPIIVHFYMSHLIGQSMMRFLGNEVDLIIASSQGVAQYLQKHGVSQKKIAIIYPPVDTNLLKPRNKRLIRPKLGLPKEAKMILYMGDLKLTRFPEEKVLRVMKELVKEVPDALLLIFAPRTNSNIERAREIRMKAETLSLTNKVKVCIKNLLEKEKTNILAATDIFFFPESHPGAVIEPPLTVLEAMASGGVVFAPKLSSLSEIITENKNGFLFEEKDYTVLAQRFADLLMSEELRIRVSHYARQTVEQKSALLTIGAKMLEHFTTLRNGQRR